jgi:hypothetical protein
LGENAFITPGTSAFDVTSGSSKEMFLAPGAPRAGWVGVRYDFDKPKTAANAD